MGLTLVIKSKALVAAAACVELAQLIVKAIARHPCVPTIRATAVLLVAILFSIPLHNVFHKRLRRPSSPLLVFWLLVSWLELVSLRTSISLGIPSRHRVSFILQCTFLVLSLCIFTLECFGPESSKGVIRLGESEEDWRESPVMTANIFSRYARLFSILFFTVTRLTQPCSVQADV
jgi:hypothetical protein